MEDLHIPYQGRIRITSPTSEADLRRVSLAPALKPKAYQPLFPEVGELNFWVFAARCRAMLEDLMFAQDLVAHQAKFGGFCELLAVALELDGRLTDAPLCAVAPLLHGAHSAPYAHQVNGRIDMSLASGKPYWAPECLYLLVAPA